MTPDDPGSGPPPPPDGDPVARDPVARDPVAPQTPALLAAPIIRPPVNAYARESPATAGRWPAAKPPAPPPTHSRRPSVAPEEADEELPRMGLLDHLEELRKRLLRSVIAVLLGFLGCWYYAEPIFHFLAAPIYRFLPPGTKLAMLGVTDAFVIYMKIAALAGLFVTFPYLLWQLWQFVSPGLYQREKRYAVPFILCGWTFFVGGGLFAYYVAFPFAVQFLLDVGKEFQPVITADRYLGFLLTVILGLGVMFELPILIVLLAAIGVVTPGFLLRYFRHAVVIIFFISAVLTPTPDIFNLCLFAVPTIGLYLLGVLGAWLIRRRPASETIEA